MSAESASSPNDPNLSGLGRALLGTNEGSKPSGPWVPPTAEELHQILPQYEIVKMLGRGGMGAVYMGRQTALDRPVAIKILSAQLEESDMGFTERFKNEARAMGKLNHPSIVSVYEFGQHESGLLYIVMEYVDGTDVAKMIAQKGRLHTEHAMAITAHVCDALAYAHERGIIHRDIKPANVMVDYDGSVKIADFGLAKVNTGGQTLGLTQSGMTMGTLHFMAPEALMLGTSVDHRADIYAVGVMLYQMLTGKLPQGVFSMPSLQVPGLDPRYDTIIAKAMMEDREARYQSARELRSDLDGILTQPVVKADPEAAKAQQPVLPTQARPQRPGGKPVMRQSVESRIPQPAARGSQSWLWASALGLLALGGAAWWMIQPKNDASLVAAAEEASSKPIGKITSAPVTPGNTSKEVWTPILDKAEDFMSYGSLELREGWVVKKADATGSTRTVGNDVMDGAIRAEFVGLNCTLRCRSINSTSYNLLRKGNWLGLQWESLDETQQERIFTTLKEVTLPDPPGKEEPFTLELRTVGKVITGSLNGRELLRVEDARGSKAGRRGISLGDAKARKIEQLILDPQPIIAAASTDPAKTDAALRMIFGKGGRATIVVGKEQRFVTRLEELPKDGFEVLELRLVAPLGQVISVSRQDIQTIAGLPSLERLVFNRVSIADADLAVFATLPRLAMLDMRDSLELTSHGLTHLADMVELKSLKLQGCKKVGLEGIQALSALKQLKELVLADMTCVDEKALPAILALQNLESLSLHGNGGVTRVFLESLEALPKLSFLTLSASQIGSAPNLGKLEALERVTLYGVSGASLDAGIRSLLEVPRLSFLSMLGGELTEQQLGLIAQMPALERLAVENTRLPASGFTGLANSKIKSISAGANDRVLDDRALLTMVPLATLKHIALLSPEPHISEAGLTAFRSKRPDVKIDRGSVKSSQIEEKAMSAVSLSSANSSIRMPVPSQPATDPPKMAALDRPFKNSLGMKFVPVPISGGAKSGEQILFGIWETRVQDYEVFAKSKKLNPPKAPFSQDANHPVVNVSWHDANAFCDWLTYKERMEGTIGVKDVYRLPSDHEWSCAVGIGGKENSSQIPSEKGSKLPDFPWDANGRIWPPPAGFGNYAGAECLEQGIRAISDQIRDTHVHTMPVGSFPPNQFGLFDISGNVWEWCEDRALKSLPHKVVRGASYKWDDRHMFLSSVRNNHDPDDRHPSTGFRVVLSIASGSSSESIKEDTASAKTWIDVKGRSIQAKFVTIRGSDVLLEVAGKATPVALSTLSPASQQQARELQATMPLVAPVVDGVMEPLLGLWHQRNDGKEIPFFPFAILADGRAGFGRLGKGLVFDGRWQCIGNDLIVSWPNGCVYEIDLGRGGPKKLSGKGFGDPDFSLEITHTGLRPAADMPTADQLADLSFVFYQKGRQQSASLGKLSLLKDGAVGGKFPLGIAHWKLENGFLMLLNAQNQCLTLFNQFERKNGKWSIRGLHVPVAEVEHSLEEG